MYRARFNTGGGSRGEVTYPNICQNQDKCSTLCRDNYKICQNNCGYNSLCLNGCTDVLNSCVSKDVGVSRLSSNKRV